MRTSRQSPRGRRPRGAYVGLLLAVLAVSAPGSAQAPDAARPRLRVATSRDYAPFSTTTSEGGVEEAAGFDVAVARAYAADRGLEIEWSRLRWPELLRDLEENRFDVAMSGVTVRPERSLAGRFSIPVAVTGAVVIAPAAAAARPPDWIEGPGVRIGVNVGGHLEKVSRGRFRSARILTFDDNASVPAALVAGQVDAIVSDSLEAPHWTAEHPGLVALAPFTRDRKAYLMPAAAADLARDLDAWLLETEADGRLARLRREHLGPGADAGTQTATPLRALLASIDERLALMPGVAEAKAVLAAPVEVPEREATVLAAAVAEARRAHCSLDPAGSVRAGLDGDAVEALFSAQIEAAKAIQRAHLPDRAPAHADESAKVTARNELETRLRPALLRIGERTTRLVACLPAALDAESVRAATRSELAARELNAEQLRAIADAIVAAAPATAQ